VAHHLGIVAVNTRTGMFYRSRSKTYMNANKLEVEVVQATAALAASQNSAIAM
jgi:superfamily II helicase